MVAAFALAACNGSGSMSPTFMDARPVDAAPPSHLVAYVSGYGPAIAWLDVDPSTGALTPVGSISAFAAGPSFLASTGAHLYAVSESTSRVGAYAIDPSSGALTFINDVAAGGDGPAHLSVDRGGKFVLVANYGNGAIAVLPLRADGGVLAARQVLNAGANAHEITTDPQNKYVLVPCKGADKVAQLTFDAVTGQLAPNAVPALPTAAGAGPRHLAFAPDGAHAYLINELDSTLTALAFDPATGRLASLQTITTRAAGATGANTTAEVWVHPSGKFVYGSNRGDDDVVTFAIDAGTGKLTLVAHTPTGGRTPRSFTLDPGGRWLYAANQASNSVTTFAIDPATGVPVRRGAEITAMQPSFVGLVALPPR